VSCPRRTTKRHRIAVSGSRFDPRSSRICSSGGYISTVTFGLYASIGWNSPPFACKFQLLYTKHMALETYWTWSAKVTFVVGAVLASDNSILVRASLNLVFKERLKYIYKIDALLEYLFPKYFINIDKLSIRYTLNRWETVGPCCFRKFLKYGFHKKKVLPNILCLL
jgi:hypothetical protein